MTYKNTKKQGDAGLGLAIAYFAAEGMTVLLPLTDSQQYDLVVDDGGELKRVQVKTSTYKKRSSYFVSLTSKGGNRSGVGKITKLTDVEYIFVATPEGSYLIPFERVSDRSSVSLNVGYDAYKVVSAGHWRA